MTEDQNVPGHPDRRQGEDDGDLRDLFHASAPGARPVDVDALFAAAQARQADRRGLAWPRWSVLSRDRSRSVDNPFPRRRTMLMTMKIAAAALVAAGGWFYFAVVPSNEASAFAEVAQKLHDAHTLAYRTAMESPGLFKTPMMMRLFFKEPNLMRVEADGGTVTVMDGGQGKQLILDPKSKTALLMEGKATQPLLARQALWSNACVNSPREMPNPRARRPSARFRPVATMSRSWAWK